jgi:hypothetical protein
MTYPYDDFNYMQCRDEEKKVKAFQRDMSVMLMEFRCRVHAGLDARSAEMFCRAIEGAESDVIGITDDDVIAPLAARIRDINETESRDDYRAEVQHQTAQYVNLKAAI